MLKPVDEAYLGNKNGNFLEIVEKIKPDIITVGADQNHTTPFGSNAPRVRAIPMDFSSLS